ncbi:TetR/AcrR family transcriptional regulator [Shewanella sp. NIFS-20-20]|uniref:TetR/AcrR family transcriptional regulator n=1 Tax=Shewanella sp. NIFS-20-20 TaxID=2853806 RepID=UPI001C47502A|nr:TetR/AcrR family transcriptional regulator [Shewanella sp. NIFS-20-20]MBV7315547.1 TetR/AcrR family transcriptional regulator [Shewanella sp. NIFS-20-20]
MKIDIADAQVAQQANRYTFTYLGRQTHRKDGIKTRHALLKACIEIIAAQGVRGVRHRAVAQQANVSLAATTYYFEDIQMLIHDALTYFAELVLADGQQLEHSAYELVARARDDEGQLGMTRQMLAAQLSQLVVSHIQQQVMDKDARLVERIFFQEALRWPLLATTIVQLEDMILANIEQFFSQLKVDMPHLAAHSLLALIRHFEYYLLINDTDKSAIAAASIEHFFLHLIPSSVP